MTRYVEVPAHEVPDRLMWETPQRYRGQAVEVAYSVGSGSEAASMTEARFDDGAPWRRVTDHSDQSTWFYRLVEEG